MLFDKYIDPCCAYCKHGNQTSNTEVICIKRGIVSSGGACRKFIYDPLKRTPSRPLSINKDAYSAADFELESEQE